MSTLERRGAEYWLEGRRLNDRDEVEAEIPMVGWVRGIFALQVGGNNDGAPLFLWWGRVARLDIGLVGRLRWPGERS